MPELPEVEIVKQSLNRNIKFQEIKKVVVRNRSLRFKIPKNFESFLTNKKYYFLNERVLFIINIFWNYDCNLFFNGMV